MKKLLALFLVLNLLLIGCSSKPKDIREEIYSDTLEILKIYELVVEEGMLLTNSDERKIDFYYNKVNNNEDLTDREKELLVNMVKLQMSFIFLQKGYLENDYDTKNESYTNYLKHKKEIEKLLKL